MNMQYAEQDTNQSIDCTDKALCRIRTITGFVTLDRERSFWASELSAASRFCFDLSREFIRNDYTVQSIRIVTNPFGEYLDVGTLASAKDGLACLSDIIKSFDFDGTRVRVAIGEARTKAEIALVPELISAFGDLCNVCVNVGLDEAGFLDNELIRCSAQAVATLSRITPRGEGNFNFTVNFNCEPLIPYFPASYHRRGHTNRFVVGLETPDLLVAALDDFNRRTDCVGHNALSRGRYDAMRTVLQYHVAQISQIIGNAGIDPRFEFGGIDSSAAPSKNCASMVEVYEKMGVDYFGAAGTVEASSLLTRVFKSISDVPLVGFSGLMLALTEDAGLARGTINADFDIRSLLTYSAVCGIGLDTVPIPGDTPTDKISALMRDTGTMAFRLNKPLTVRLFPAPGLAAGDMTRFESDDLCNCLVLAVP